LTSRVFDKISICEKKQKMQRLIRRRINRSQINKEKEKSVAQLLIYDELAPQESLA